MSPRPDDHVRPLLGAYVLGHLDPIEALDVGAHLQRCAACREEADELAAVAEVLPLADPERIGTPEPQPPGELYDEVLARIRRERGRRVRAQRRGVAVRVGAVAAALALVLVVALASTQPADDDGGAVVVAMTAARLGVAGEAVVHEDPSSTWVELTTSGLEAGETYAVWLEETGTGERAPLGTFVGVEGDLYISLYSTLPRERAGSVGVSTPDGTTVMEGAIVPVRPTSA
jgi:Anti-sigma-K factor rskA/Putative zinc-finger